MKIYKSIDQLNADLFPKLYEKEQLARLKQSEEFKLLINKVPTAEEYPKDFAMFTSICKSGDFTFDNVYRDFVDVWNKPITLENKYV